MKACPFDIVESKLVSGEAYASLFMFGASGFMVKSLLDAANLFR